MPQCLRFPRLRAHPPRPPHRDPPRHAWILSGPGLGVPAAWILQSTSGERLFPPILEASIRTFLVSLIGATAVAAGILAVRHQKQSTEETSAVSPVPPGESVPAEIVLERLRKAGI